MAGTRVDQERIKVTVDGRDLGIFDSFSGGGAQSDDTKYRPGGMGLEVSLGGTKSRDAITVGRLLDTERDLPLIKWLDERAGSGQVGIVRQFLNRDKSPAGSPVNYTGTLMKTTLPDHDSTSSDAAIFTLEVSADEAIA